MECHEWIELGTKRCGGELEWKGSKLLTTYYSLHPSLVEGESHCILLLLFGCHYKICWSTNPAVDLTDDTDLIAIDHLLLLVVLCCYQLPESTGAEMLTRRDTCGPLILMLHFYLIPTNSICRPRRVSFCSIPLGLLNNKHVLVGFLSFDQSHTSKTALCYELR